MADALPDLPSSAPGTASSPWPPSRYHGMRMRHAHSLLLGFLRRWGVYLAVAAMVIGAGTNSPVAIVEGATVALALPLFESALRGPGWWLAALLAYALAGALPVLLTRPLWWPRRWAEAERALPLEAAELRTSDLRVQAWVMLPWQALLAAGVASLWWRDPATVHAVRAQALAGWALTLPLAALLGNAWMRRVRQAVRPRVGAVAGSQPASATGLPPALPRARHWLGPLLWWPLRRGPAQRSGRALLAACLALGGAVAALAAWPAATPWTLAAMALVALSATSVLRARVAEDLAPLWLACRGLPLAPTAAPRAGRWLALAPTLAALLGAASALRWPMLRPAVTLAYGAALAAAAALEAFVDPRDAGDRASRWLFTLVLSVALASEVMA